MRRRDATTAARASGGATAERTMPRLPGGFSLPPFGLHQWLALVIVCIALWAVGLLWLGLQAGAGWAGAWREDVRFHVYLETADKTEALSRALRQLRGVRGVRVVPTAESRAWLNSWLGGADAVDVDEFLSALPTVIEVRPDGGGDAFLFADIADTARAFDAEVNRGEERLAEAGRVMRRIQGALWFATLIMAVAMVIVISNTLRMILLARADEVRLMRLLGADEVFVRLPFVLEGGLLGGMAGLLAWALLWPPVLTFGGWLAQLHIDIRVTPLLLPLLLGGALVGCLGALLATVRMEREASAGV